MCEGQTGVGASIDRGLEERGEWTSESREEEACPPSWSRLQPAAEFRAQTKAGPAASGTDTASFAFFSYKVTFTATYNKSILLEVPNNHIHAQNICVSALQSLVLPLASKDIRFRLTGYLYYYAAFTACGTIRIRRWGIDRQCNAIG